MKHNVNRYGTILLLIGLVALAAGRANAQDRHRNEIHIESLSWGVSSGQTARISVVNSLSVDGSTRSTAPIIVRIQLLNTEGEVLAESDEITVEPGNIRFWDAPYEQIGGLREATGRLQLRATIALRNFVTNPINNRNDLPLATLEIFDPVTGRTVSYNPFVTVDYVEARTER